MNLLVVDTVVLCAGQGPDNALALALEAVGGARLAAELDAARAIDGGVRLAAAL